tara:strand:+ start:228 stop:632 length:405 start_codon:yes stop_codon:yes gene_type:complete
MNNIKECKICLNSINSEALHCYQCNETLCINCCNNLETFELLLFNNIKAVSAKYKCPFCRYINNKDLNLLNKKDLIRLIYNEKVKTEKIELINNNNYLYINELINELNKYINICNLLINKYKNINFNLNRYISN